MILTKLKNEYESFDIYLEDEDKILMFKQTGDDHTFYARYKTLEKLEKIDFAVTSSDVGYENFVSLYERIVSGNVFGHDKTHKNYETEKEIQTSTSWYKKTVSDGIISIMSDAYPMSCPNILTIKREENAIVLEFEKVEGREYKSKYDISINIRQSGSRIYDLAFPFRLLFEELQTVPEIEPKQLKKE